jgi:hypothetical protein
MMLLKEIFTTIYDIAERAGFSPGTVSRTISNIGYIKEGSSIMHEK